jgi:hypothetical protein
VTALIDNCAVVHCLGARLLVPPAGDVPLEAEPLEALLDPGWEIAWEVLGAG